MIVHPFPPLYDKNSRVLILGSFPSVRSREQNFFYGHERNRFWQVVASLFGAQTPDTIEKKKELILTNGLALWDVIKSCEIAGSADASIKNVTPNDIPVILNGAPIERIFTNGKTAFLLYRKFILEKAEREAVCLPSTSPANAAFSLSRLIDAWRIIKQ